MTSRVTATTRIPGINDVKGMDIDFLNTLDEIDYHGESKYIDCGELLESIHNISGSKEIYIECPYNFSYNKK